jgi:hypothetical protein
MIFNTKKHEWYHQMEQDFREREGRERAVRMFRLMLGMGMIAFVCSFISGCVEQACITKRVVSVGGCDKSGWCGVNYGEGVFGRELYPSVGQPFKVCK